MTKIQNLKNPQTHTLIKTNTERRNHTHTHKYFDVGCKKLKVRNSKSKLLFRTNKKFHSRRKMAKGKWEWKVLLQVFSIYLTLFDLRQKDPGFKCAFCLHENTNITGN